jgi:hypothetical protein
VGALAGSSDGRGPARGEVVACRSLWVVRTASCSRRPCWVLRGEEGDGVL